MNDAQRREEEQQRKNREQRQREEQQRGEKPQRNKGQWVNPKSISWRERQDRYLERNGLLNYQTQGLSAAEISARYANANVRITDNSNWFKDNYGQARPDPLAQQIQIDIPQPGTGGNLIQTPRVSLSPDERQEQKFNYVPASNGLVIKEKYQTVWLNGDPSQQGTQADPNAPIFASIEQAKAGQANWEDIATEDRKGLLSDPLFYKNGEITKYEPWMQQQILADPNFQWDKLPKWQKMYFELSSSPAGMAAAQGGLLGLGGGPVGSAVGAGLGATLGWAAAKSGYDATKEFWQQDTGSKLGDLVAGAFGFLNFAAEQAEKTAGMGFQIANAAADKNKSVTDVLNKESWNAGANFFEVITPAYIDMMNDGKGELGWDDLLKIVPSVWMTAKIGDLILHPEKYKGEELYLGANAPIQLDQNWVERIDQAREEIKAGRPYREVMLDMQSGVVAQMGDIAGQAFADPLNFLPRMQTSVGAKIAEVSGNKVAAQALSQSSGLGEASRRYKTLVQTGQALTIDPNFKVDQMGMFSRFIAGVNEQGQVRKGSLIPTSSGLLDPVTDKKLGFIQSMTEQNPHSRAQTGAGMFYENVSALLTRFEDPHEAGKYLKALAANDMDTWAGLGTRFAESPEFYTVLPALKEFNTAKLDAIIQQWDISLNNRDALTRISGLLGEEPGKWLEDTNKRGTYEQDFQRLKKITAEGKTPEAAAIKADIESGRITPDFLKQTVDLFTGEGALSWHPGQWKAMVMDAMGTHFDEWVTKRLMLDKSPDAVSAFYRTTALMKQAQSILLLGGSPDYAITNGLSNMVNRAFTGIYGYMTPNQINGFLDRMGMTPARMEEGVGIGGQVEQMVGKSDVKTSAMDKAMRGKGALTTAKDALSKISRGMPMNKLSSMFEKVEGKQGFAIAMKQFWSQSWRRGVGFSRMSPEMVNTIKGMGIAPERIYAAIEAGMNQAEIEKALFGRYEGVQARSLINDAAQKTGMSASQTAVMLEQIGVLDTLDTYLKGQTTKEGIQAAFARANKIAQDYVDMQTGDDLKAIAESVKQRVGLEGAAAVLDVVQKAQGTYTDAWMDHYFRFGEVMQDLNLLDDPAMRSRAIDFNYEVSDGEFRRVNARNAANYQGIFEAWGMSGNPEAMKVLASIGESDAAMSNAYRQMREIRKGFFDKYRNDWDNPAKWDEWDAGNAQIDRGFKKGFADKKAAEIKQADALGNIYESLHGPAAGEAARLWWKDVVDFNAEILAREQEFRATLADMTKEQRDAAKRQFYSETKIAMIAELDQINADGIGRLERVIKKGGQGTVDGGPTQTPPPTPPTDGGVASEIPQPKTADQQSGRVIAEAEGKQKQAQQDRVDEFNALMAAAEQRNAADARETAARENAVWEVAGEYWARGGNFSRDILQDGFILKADLRKAEYGGIPDLKGLSDPRITPELVRQVLEARKAIKEAAGIEAASAAFNDQPTAKKFDVTQINEDTTVLRAIALHGGLDLNIAKDLTGEKRPKSAPGVFTRKGVNIDEMARMLADDGYPIDLTRADDPGGIIQATEMISKARAGIPVYPVGHDFSVDIAKAEQAYFDTIDNVFPPTDPALWQAEFTDTIARGDLTKMWGMIGDYPETFDPAALDGYIRMADETAARVEAEARDLEVAGHLTRAEEAIAQSQTRAEAATTRQLLKEKFIESFGDKVSEARIEAWMEVSDAVIAHFARITGESADVLYNRYYGDSVKVEGEGGREAIDGLQQAYNRIEGGANRQMTQADAENYARMLVRAGENEFISAIRNEPNKADRIAILDAAHNIDAALTERVAKGEMDILLQESGGFDPTQPPMSIKGAVTFDADGIKATIHAFEAADFTTLVHENGHVFRRMLADVAERTSNPYIKADLATIEEWAGVKDGAWGRAAEEKFARGFEKYIADGRAPTPALVKAFEGFKKWMLEVYKTITGSAIDVKLSDDVRRVFDRMLGAENLKIDMDAMLLQMNYDPKVYYVNPLGIPSLKVENLLEGDVESFDALRAKAQALKARMQEGSVQPNPTVDRGLQTAMVSEHYIAGNEGGPFYPNTRYGDDAPIPHENVQALSQWTNEKVQANLEKIQKGSGQTLFQTADPVDSPAFQNWFGESKVVDENGRPLVVYHGTPNGSFTEFKRFPAYFSEQKKIADIYRSSSASSLTPKKTTTQPETYAVYLKVKKPFDTRLPEVRQLFEREYMGQGGENWADMYMTGLSKRGLPDWTNANDIYEFIQEKGYDFDGIVLDEGGLQGLDRGISYAVFEPTQVKSVENRGTFDPADPNILFQEANQPFGAYDAASQFHPMSEVKDQGWQQQVRPLMDAMQEGAINQLSDRPMDEAMRDGSPEANKMLRGYMKQVQGEMATTKLATVRWGEKQRDFAMLNYNKRYGFDRAFESVMPYQFYTTRSAMNYAARILDKPALYSNFARLKNQQDRYERDIPERLRGKIKIDAPWLPEWMGGGLYIDPSNLFFPAQALKPIERAMQDKNYQTIETERILQEWSQDGQYSQQQIAEAAQSQSGSIWERANEEAKLRRESETANPMDFFSSFFGPAWYLSTPLNLAGIKVPGLSQGDPNKVSQTPLGNTARAVDTVTQGTWAEPVGDVIGLLGKAEDWGRAKLNLPTRGEYGEYYTKRQVANMVAEGLINPEEASLAMIEQSGKIWEDAAQRVDMELAMRVPGAGALYGLLHEGDPRSILPSLFGAGLLPEGELEYRGLKQEWNEAWKKSDAGDKNAITDFFEEHPEYEAYLAKGKDGDELLKSFLIGQVWDGYMDLGTTNQKQARAEMGDLFAQSFLDKETRSYETLDIETLTMWARMMNKKVPSSGQLTVGGQQVQSQQGQPPKLDLYSPSVTGITDQFFEERKKQFPNYYEQQQGYYALPKSERKSYLFKNPELKEYWDWKNNWYDAYPQYKPIFNGQAFKTVDTSNWPPGLSDYVTAYAYTGKRMPSGAYAALEQVWIMEGQPMSDFETWLNSQVVPAMKYDGGSDE